MAAHRGPTSPRLGPGPATGSPTTARRPAHADRRAPPARSRPATCSTRGTSGRRTPCGRSGTPARPGRAAPRPRAPRWPAAPAPGGESRRCACRARPVPRPDDDTPRPLPSAQSAARTGAPWPAGPVTAGRRGSRGRRRGSRSPWAWRSGRRCGAGRSVASGSASTSGSAGPAKSRSPSTTRTGHVILPRSPRRAAVAAADAGGQRRRVDPRLGRQPGEVLRDRVGRVAVALDGSGDDPGPSSRNRLSPTPATTISAKRPGSSAAKVSSAPSPEREPDGVDGSVGQARRPRRSRARRTPRGRGAWRRRRGRAGRGRSPRDRRRRGGRPTRCRATCGRGRGEAVDEEHRFVAHGRRFYTAGPGRGRVGGPRPPDAAIRRDATGYGSGAARGRCRGDRRRGGTTMGSVARPTRAGLVPSPAAAPGAGSDGERLHDVVPGRLRRVALSLPRRRGDRRGDRRPLRRGRAGLPRGVDLHRAAPSPCRPCS